MDWKRFDYSERVDSVDDYGSIIRYHEMEQEWQASVSGWCTYAEAQRYVRELSLCGRRDWRLPTREELRALVEEGGAALLMPAPERVPAWTATPNAQDPLHIWCVNLSGGEELAPVLEGRAVVCAVRDDGPEKPTCPRPAPTPNPRFEPRALDGDEGVLDRETGLLWQRLVDATLYTPAAASAYVASLRLLGLGGWRLPSRAELRRLLVYTSKTYPAIDEWAFPGTPFLHPYHTATPVAEESGRHWAISFQVPGCRSWDLSERRYVRAVREEASRRPEQVE